MVWLGIDEVLELHKMLIVQTGGSYELRDRGILEGILASGESGFGGVEFYPSVLEKIAKVASAMIQNHPFVDGNKRIGMMILLVLLELNGIKIEFSNDEIENLGLSLAEGRCKYEDLLKILQEKCGEC
ncbi:MAG: type II toxin-antitoxin system death-on-curing family toxin [Helicobacter sp.]|uniref:type II toxin-antitoxin system death-on-curing family toxin n=1 Tax=Helicobacter sp. TaxID=218 RepID=UPI0023D76145|nr:type II toxin-antitoxin system death-on-curing family toxin [Helicobacter sp.]MDE7175336.1 type II toxin-antitoxin system death-on-curing family toxin [Helicobacter sp.]